MKVENKQNLDGEQAMTVDERGKLIEYLEQHGWTAQQILDLFKYLSK